jgi:hypothetical protein
MLSAQSPLITGGPASVTNTIARVRSRRRARQPAHRGSLIDPALPEIVVITTPQLHH